ncbi:Ankyrin repeat and SOCS box protein 5 [Chelonia mydas]|uniref:Ankyrin repeat and SOCS box protein 5 n=1 Tax=Chelonia mydas TaxID=8469 RepID=M7BL84_CHEMY|nr:Ankyrin repeat and SOCS box protein 5 [Chelonia mydas]
MTVIEENRPFAQQLSNVYFTILSLFCFKLFVKISLAILSHFYIVKGNRKEAARIADEFYGIPQGQAGNVSFGMLSTPENRLSLIRRRKRKREDMFTEVMNASETADTELRAWRISLSEKLDMDMKSRKASNEQEQVAQDKMLRIMRDQADMLRRLVELQEQKQAVESLCRSWWTASQFSF